MASKTGHLATGAASGVLSAVLVSKLNIDVPLYILILTFLAGIPGGTAPDWLEITSWSPETGRQSVIKHRTITHWGVAWIILWLISLFLIPVVVWAPIAVGFTGGCLMHLLVDWPNPMGVPWIRIKKRHSLKLWKSGENEVGLTVLFWSIASFVAYMAWYFPYFGAHWPWELSNQTYQHLITNVINTFKLAYSKWN